MSKWMYFLGGLVTAGLGMAAYTVLEESNNVCSDTEDDADVDNDNVGFADADAIEPGEPSSADETLTTSN